MTGPRRFCSVTDFLAVSAAPTKYGNRHGYPERVRELGLARTRHAGREHASIVGVVDSLPDPHLFQVISELFGAVEAHNVCFAPWNTFFP